VSTIETISSQNHVAAARSLDAVYSGVGIKFEVVDLNLPHRHEVVVEEAFERLAPAEPVRAESCDQFDDEVVALSGPEEVPVLVQKHVEIASDWIAHDRDHIERQVRSTPKRPDELELVDLERCRAWVEPAGFVATLCQPVRVQHARSIRGRSDGIDERARSHVAGLLHDHRWQAARWTEGRPNADVVPHTASARLAEATAWRGCVASLTRAML
jgi:hypothetical protein